MRRKLLIALAICIPIIGLQIPWQEASGDEPSVQDTTDTLSLSQARQRMIWGNQRLDNAVPEVEAALEHYQRAARALDYYIEQGITVEAPAETITIQPAVLRSPMKGVAPSSLPWETDLGIGRDEGAIKVTFRTNTIGSSQGIISRDHRGFGNGGHFSVWIRNDTLVYRLQTTEQSRYLTAAPIRVDSTYEAIVGWGPDGQVLFLNEHLAGWNPGMTQGTTPTERLSVVGALCSRCDVGSYNSDSPFQGEIIKLEVWTSYRDIDRALPEGSTAGPWIGNNDTTVSQ